MPLNANQILAVFPQPVLTKIMIEPNLNSITLQQSKHNGNLASIKSNLGNGLTGLMVISMKPEIFATIHPEPFALLTNLGPAPNPDAIDITAASSDIKMSDLYKAYALQSNI